jgi:hypothetical protein
LVAGAWEVKAMGRNTDKGNISFSLDEEDIKHILLDCVGTIN